MPQEVVRSRVFADTYRDSVELMRIAAELERLAGVRRAALLAATPANRDLLTAAGLLDGAAAAARPSDLVVAVAAETEEAADAAVATAGRLLATAPPATTAGSAPVAPRTLAAALHELPTANLAMISTPGPYATAETLKALKRGLHVFLFSDNVSRDDEVMLKRLAARKGLLLMGPDCGTAILDGVPLGFANAVRRGRIGLCGASGTGLQQVSCLIDRLGQGVSQVIGTGGHDLGEEVGGLMMLGGIERLAGDAGTAVLVLVSKPPAPAVARRVLAAARGAGKPVVVCFLGGDPAVARAAGAHPAATLEEAATRAVALAGGEAGTPDPGAGDERRQRARAAARPFAAGQRALQGLFSGGTLCAEAALILADLLHGATPRYTLLDLGDDEFTVARPHPMIDFRLRNERIVTAAADPAVAVILLDVVLGYGSHPDPAGALAPALAEARARSAATGRAPVVVASVCGTAADPQHLPRQEERLAASGVLLAPSNAAAARLAAEIVRQAEAAGAQGGG